MARLTATELKGTQNHLCNHLGDEGQMVQHLNELFQVREDTILFSVNIAVFVRVKWMAGHQLDIFS